MAMTSCAQIPTDWQSHGRACMKVNWGPPSDHTISGTTVRQNDSVSELCGGVGSHRDYFWPASETVDCDKKFVSTIATKVHGNLLKGDLKMMGSLQLDGRLS